jgi:hypothetical protein
MCSMSFWGAGYALRTFVSVPQIRTPSELIDPLGIVQAGMSIPSALILNYYLQEQHAEFVADAEGRARDS